RSGSRSSAARTTTSFTCAPTCATAATSCATISTSRKAISSARSDATTAAWANRTTRIWSVRPGKNTGTGHRSNSPRPPRPAPTRPQPRRVESACQAVASARHRGERTRLLRLAFDRAQPFLARGVERLHIAAQLAAFLDQDLAVADLAADPAGSVDQQLLARGEFTFKVAMDLGDVDADRA